MRMNDGIFFRRAGSFEHQSFSDSPPSIVSRAVRPLADLLGLDRTERSYSKCTFPPTVLPSQQLHLISLSFPASPSKCDFL